jgi:hypothetical protein
VGTNLRYDGFFAQIRGLRSVVLGERATWSGGTATGQAHIVPAGASAASGSPVQGFASTLDSQLARTVIDSQIGPGPGPAPTLLMMIGE